MIQRLNDWITAIRNRLQAIIPPGSLSERFARGAFWSLTSMAISQGLAMLASIVGARLLGVDQFPSRMAMTAMGLPEDPLDEIIPTLSP